MEPLCEFISNFRPVSLQQRFGNSLRQNKNRTAEFLTNNSIRTFFFFFFDSQSSGFFCDWKAQIIMFETLMCWRLSILLFGFLLLPWVNMTNEKPYSLDINFKSFVLLRSGKI